MGLTWVHPKPHLALKGRGEVIPSLAPSKVILGVHVKKRLPMLCLINLSITPLQANLGPVIANMNSKFIIFIKHGRKKIQGISLGG